MPFNGKRLKELREGQGLSQRKLARKIKICSKDISWLERGLIKNPSYNKIIKISAFFKVNIETFKSGEVF
jgi:transcriptional regulator with XRE-family HTH domain